MAKRKHHHEEHLDESWLIPYSDLLTLLLALFIVLFASSTVDAQKLQQMASSMNAAFDGGEGVLEYQAPTESIEVPEKEEDTLSEEDELKQKYAAEMEDLGEIQQKINHYIQAKGLSFSLETTLTEEGLLITILDQALFDSGSATVKGEAVQLAHEISELVYTETPRRITVSGHTDNVPVGNSMWQSNWDLSTMRAINFMKILLDNTNLDPANFVASGYGEYHPVATNDTKEGRQKNRRVEVLIKPNFTKSDIQ
ncbi:flagellar motor protein MotB [Niallia taxi]|uniref:flagellar motor protein MotB n=1 Tax=Niallia taxi TaxID=2499688 RepID=UPI0015F4C7A8|nr:flagellar motor protein MotB [Niallia taxi]